MARIELRCTDREKELYVQAAESAGLSLSEWLRSLAAVSVTAVGALEQRPVSPPEVKTPAPPELATATGALEDAPSVVDPDEQQEYVLERVEFTKHPSPVASFLAQRLAS